MIDFMRSKKRRDQALDLVTSRFNIAQKYTQPYFTRFQGYYELYRSYLRSGSLPWRANLFIPKTFEIVETVAPRIAQAQRTFRARPVEGSDVKASQAFTDLLQYQFECSDMETVIEELTKEALIYGTGVAKVSWDKESKMPRAEVVDIFDFFPDPKARNDQELKYAIHRVERDIEDLEANPNYDKQALKRLRQGEGIAHDNQERQQRLGVIGVSAEDTSRKRFEVLEYHGYFEDGIYIITVAGGEVLRITKSPYGIIPFVVVNDHAVPHELYGIGEIEPVESLQNELNDVRNQRLDNVKLNINSMWKVVNGAVTYEDELVSRPGGVVHLNRPDGLLPNDRQVVPSEAFTEESVIKSDMERTTGANSPLSGALVSPMGGTQGGVMNRTATAYQGAINQADKRFSAKVQQIKRGILRIGRIFLDYDRKFLTGNQIIRVVGEQGNEFLMQMSPELIASKIDLALDVEYLDEFQVMQQNIGLLQTLAGVPNFNAAKWAAEQVLPKAGVKNYREYLLPPEPKETPGAPRINYQIRGNMEPDTIAKIVQQASGVQTNPQLIAAKMRTSMREGAVDQAKTMSEMQANMAEESENE